MEQTYKSATDKSQGCSRAAHVLERCREIATYTEVPGEVTRTFLCGSMHGVHALLRGWMEAAGMSTFVDAAGNLRGVYPASKQPSSRVILGSHLDTVPRAGAFDGLLGVVLALAIVEASSEALPIAIEIIGFSEEEGVRFHKPFLGSLAVVGHLDAGTLGLQDAHGITVAEAIRGFGLDPSQVPKARLTSDAIAYFEMHIEQGPVLEHVTAQVTNPVKDSLTVTEPAHLGVVEAIVGQSRLLLTFTGQANHAGTTPMHLRRDALAAAAECILAAELLARETPGLVATIGRIDAEPGASNVVPGIVHATLDVRHADDNERQRSVLEILARANVAANARHVRLTHEFVHEQPSVPMNKHLVRLLETAVTRAGHEAHRMPSGAGHDAMILAPYLPSAMLFLSSPGGLSHHPDESVLATDIDAAIETGLEFIRLLSHDEGLAHA